MKYDGQELLRFMENSELVSNIPMNDTIHDNQTGDLRPVYMVMRSNYKVLDKRADGSEYTSYDHNAAKFGQMINNVSGDHYSHVTISFDDTFENMYSYENNKGFVSDSISDNEIWLTTSNIYLTVMYVEQDAFKKMTDYVAYLEANKGDTSYALSSLVTTTLGSSPAKMDKRFVCSTFCGYILGLSDPKNIHRDYAHLRPEDFTVLPRAFYVLSSPNAIAFKKSIPMIKSLTKSIYEEHKDELLDYNNHLPKLMLKDQFTKLKTFDKIIDWALKRIEN